MKRLLVACALLSLVLLAAARAVAQDPGDPQFIPEEATIHISGIHRDPLGDLVRTLSFFAAAGCVSAVLAYFGFALRLPLIARRLCWMSIVLGIAPLAVFVMDAWVLPDVDWEKCAGIVGLGAVSLIGGTVVFVAIDRQVRAERKDALESAAALRKEPITKVSSPAVREGSA